MVITPFGLSALKIQTPAATVLIDPFDAKQGLKSIRAQADLVLLTQADGRDRTAGGPQAFVVDQPGEFEVAGVAVTGVPTGDGKQTLFVLTVEDITLCHLGDLDRLPSDAELAAIDTVDVLFVPVGGHGVLDARRATEVIGEIEPRLVIPLQTKLPGLKATRDPVSAFVKEFGLKQAAPQDKLKLTKKDLPQEDTEAIVLQPA